MKKAPLTRREFLKLAGLAGLSYAAPSVLSTSQKQPQPNGDQPNVLIVVFDSWAAPHCSLYGYPRDTTPNINRLAERGTVYHNHYAAGGWTVPGTASLLTGTLAWDHRAFGMVNGVVSNDYVNKSIFNVFSDYHRVAYTHNHLADQIIQSFFADIDNLIPRADWYLQKERLLDIFNRDPDVAAVAFNRALKQEDEYGYSLFMNELYDVLDKDTKSDGLDELFPLGVPGRVVATEKFLLEDGMDNLLDTVLSAPSPSITYCHFFPPHAPYKTRADFYGRFADDDYDPLRKPIHVLNKGYTYEQMEKMRIDYDEYILYVDAEFSRLYDMLEQKKVLDDTWLVLTTDHGEMFERGIIKHSTFLMNQPIVHVPLVIFEPGQTTRQDVFARTSALDLLPTLAHLTGHEVPPWGQGKILPPYAEQTSERDIMVMDSRRNAEKEPIKIGTFTLVRGTYKMMYYKGYGQLQGGDLVELYDIDADPEELNDLSSSMPGLRDDMLQTIKEKLAEVNAPYE